MKFETPLYQNKIMFNRSRWAKKMHYNPTVLYFLLWCVFIMNLETKIEKNKAELKAENITEPYINDEYVCKTCGNVGKSHPNTSFCFICGDDNWIPVADEVGR